MMQMLLKMQMHVLMYYANALKYANANFNLWCKMLLKMQMQILMYDANALKDANANFNLMMQIFHTRIKNSVLSSMCKYLFYKDAIVIFIML